MAGNTIRFIKGLDKVTDTQTIADAKRSREWYKL